MPAISPANVVAHMHRLTIFSFFCGFYFRGIKSVGENRENLHPVKLYGTLQDGINLTQNLLIATRLISAHGHQGHRVKEA